jgi:threonine dehydrogenase-like Zn-dependent dehydrogenase
MRAAVFKQQGSPLQVDVVPDPIPDPDEVVLRVGRCGICGTDIHLTDGHVDLLPAGAVLGHEFSGEVVALGSAVSRLRIGDIVCAMPMRGCGRCVSCLAGEPGFCSSSRMQFGSGFAQYVRASAIESVRLPASLSIADGALVEPLSVALRGVRLSGISPGSRVLVLGAGPIGLGVVFWARRLGAGHIAVMEGVPERRALAMAMGASQCLDPQTHAASLADAALPADGASAPELVFECVGRPGLLGLAVKVVRPRGTIISLGFCFAADPIVPAAIAPKELTLKFPYAYGLRDFEHTVDVLDAGHIEPRAMVTSTVSLDAAPSAIESLRRSRSECKVLIDPWA